MYVPKMMYVLITFILCFTFYVLEVALQNISMFFRSEPKWEVVEPAPDIGKASLEYYYLFACEVLIDLQYSSVNLYEFPMKTTHRTKYNLQIE